MPRGERDYTQRVLATIRPQGLVGGRLLTVHDFESLTSKSADYSSSFGITTSTGTVWNGDASAYLTSTNASIEYYQFHFPIPTADIIAAELVSLVADYYMAYAELSLIVWNGTEQLSAIIRSTAEGSNAVIQIKNSAGAYENIYSVPITSLLPAWHILYLSLNVTKKEYVLAVGDLIRVNLAGKGLYVTSYPTFPAGQVRGECKSYPFVASTMYFDDFIISCEEL